MYNLLRINHYINRIFVFYFKRKIYTNLENSISTFWMVFAYLEMKLLLLYNIIEIIIIIVNNIIIFILRYQ